MQLVLTALPLAHAASAWQPVATLAGAALGIVLLLVVSGVIAVRRPHDLVLPVSAAVLLSASVPVRGEILHDLAVVALPLGVGSLAALIALARRRHGRTS